MPYNVISYYACDEKLRCMSTGLGATSCCSTCMYIATSQWAQLVGMQRNSMMLRIHHTRIGLMWGYSSHGYGMS